MNHTTTSPPTRRRPRHGRLIAALVTLLLGVVGVIASPAGTAGAAYPGGNGKLAFTRTNQVYTANANGTGIVKLTTSGKNYWPRWSPDGQRIAYINETSAGVKNIWVMNANGSNKQKVTSVGNVQPPTWSPDGATLAFGGGNVGGFPVLMTIKSTSPFGSPTTVQGDDGGGLAPVVVQGGAAWAPDGHSIMFPSTQFPDSPDSYILEWNTTTREVTPWVASGGSCCGPGTVTQPAWSANGARTAFTYTVNGVPTVLVRTYPAFGTVTFATQSQDEQFAFSPNGQRVAFMNDANGTARIFTAAANGSGRTAVITNGYQPDWQPVP